MGKFAKKLNKKNRRNAKKNAFENDFYYGYFNLTVHYKQMFDGDRNSVKDALAIINRVSNTYIDLCLKEHITDITYKQNISSTFTHIVTHPDFKKIFADIVENSPLLSSLISPNVTYINEDNTCTLIVEGVEDSTYNDALFGYIMLSMLMEKYIDINDIANVWRSKDIDILDVLYFVLQAPNEPRWDVIRDFVKRVCATDVYGIDFVKDGSAA